MPDKFNAVSVIGLSGAAIIFIIVTWIQGANKGWVRGISLSVGGVVTLLGMCFVWLFLVVLVGNTFGNPGILIFLVLSTWWGWSRADRQGHGTVGSDPHLSTNDTHTMQDLTFDTDLHPEDDGSDSD